MTMDNILHRLRGKLEVDSEFGTFLGDTRIRLLEAIDQHGSISQAAKAVPLSYKAAWDAVDAMNNLADQPLVQRSTGGKHGGGTQLTAYGKKVIALYRALEAEYQAALDRLTESMNDGQASDFKQFRQLLKRLSMKTSARNQFAGHIVGLREGHVDFEVRLKLDDENEIVAVITGHISLSQIKKTGEQGNILAIIGLILGYLEIVGVIIFGIVWIGIIAAAGTAGMYSN